VFDSIGVRIHLPRKVELSAEDLLHETTETRNLLVSNNRTRDRKIYIYGFETTNEVSGGRGCKKQSRQKTVTEFTEQIHASD